MSEDDWSLKGKRKTRWVDSDNQLDDTPTGYPCYDKSDIEVLRQKLIEDFTDVYNGSSMLTLPVLLSPTEMQKIIDKRFGVE